MEVKGYKVFNPDWTCRGKQYTCPGDFREDVDLEVCGRGMHFCKKASDCFNYYRFEPYNRVAEVIAHGLVLEAGNKCCTDHLEVVREIPWAEMLTLVNTGENCTGYRNSGDCNSGDYNSGDCNSGDYNSGDCNSGNRNSGDYNSGNRNSGDYNSGDYNSGNYNSGNYNSGNYNPGNYNSGDWNKSSFNTGCFNTEEGNLRLFNKPSPWTYHNWLRSKARYLLNTIPRNVVEWVLSEDMTDEEKAKYPTHETTGGYLKVLDVSDCAVLWWGTLDNVDKQTIMNIPNFDKAIFKEITGIDVEGE